MSTGSSTSGLYVQLKRIADANEKLLTAVEAGNMPKLRTTATKVVVGPAHHKKVHNVMHEGCPYCTMMEVAVDLKDLARAASGRLNENPSMQGRAVPSEQATYRLAKVLIAACNDDS